MSTLCHSCLSPVKTGLYCKRCRDILFSGRSIEPLTFDKSEFYTKRRELQDRMSISGVQDKISLSFDDSGSLTPTATDGRYILKPVPIAAEIRHHGEVGANEHISMQISKQVFGIQTAESALIPFKDGELAYITKRFDYAVDGTKLDQEDFASVLGKTSSNSGKDYKYDLSYHAIAEAIKKYVPASAPALEELYMRVLLNYLIGNDDAHLKNFSIYRAEGRQDFTLTPNYDILFSKHHVDGGIGLMALDLFDDFESVSYAAAGFPTLEDFEIFGLEVCSIPPKRLARIVQKFLGSIEAVAEFVTHSFLSQEAKAAYLINYSTNLNKRLCYTIGNEPYTSKSVLVPIIKKAQS